MRSLYTPRKEFIWNTESEVYTLVRGGWTYIPHPRPRIGRIFLFPRVPAAKSAWQCIRCCSLFVISYRPAAQTARLPLGFDPANQSINQNLSSCTSCLSPRFPSAEILYR